LIASIILIGIAFNDLLTMFILRTYHVGKNWHACLFRCILCASRNWAQNRKKIWLWETPLLHLARTFAA